MKTFQNLETEKSFFREKCCISYGDQKVYFNEIILPNQFKKLYSKERIMLRLKKAINTASSRPSFNIPSSLCQKNGIEPGKIVILRITNSKKTYEIITKVGAWRRINVPREVIDSLNIVHEQKVIIEIIKETDHRNSEKKDLVSLLEHKKNIKMINRENNYVTIYSRRKFPITLPKKVSLEPELIECFFLIHGDGHYKEKLFFTNKDIGLHESVIDLLQKYLGIPTSIWKMRINLHESYREKEAKNFWLNNLKFDKRQFYPSISRTKFNTSAQGNLRIVIDYPIVSEIFRNIFIYMQQNLNRKSSFYALNGLFAAEGGAQISEVGLHRITLSYNFKEKEMFQKILKNCNVLHLFKDIEQGNNHGIFVLEGWEKLYLFFKEFAIKKITPFNFHNARKQRAINGMIEHSFTKTMCKYLMALSQNKKYTVKEFSEKLQMREDSCLSTLRKKQYSPFINISGLGINKQPFSISITKQGQELLTIISTMRGEKMHE
ncbi:hypothetical protein HYU22_01310 [Candidatus Woesearchaeota archaeon]|nr:hypothetical protein [Candidatus Woesearchaeota archaeon]